MIYSYTTHVPRNIPNTLLPTFYKYYTLVLTNLPCDTHLYSFNRYITVLITILPSMQLFVPYK